MHEQLTATFTFDSSADAADDECDAPVCAPDEEDAFPTASRRPLVLALPPATIIVPSSPEADEDPSGDMADADIGLSEVAHGREPSAAAGRNKLSAPLLARPWSAAAISIAIHAGVIGFGLWLGLGFIPPHMRSTRAGAEGQWVDQGAAMPLGDPTRPPTPSVATTMPPGEVPLRQFAKALPPEVIEPPKKPIDSPVKLELPSNALLLGLRDPSLKPNFHPRTPANSVMASTASNKVDAKLAEQKPRTTGVSPPLSRQAARLTPNGGQLQGSGNVRIIGDGKGKGFAPPQGLGRAGGSGVGNGFDKDGIPIPSYPPLAKKRGQEGRVLLTIYVRPNGTVGNVAVEQDCGFPLLTQAALQAAWAAPFSPGTQDGAPVACAVTVPFIFKLDP